MSSLREILEAAGDQIRDTMEAESDWDIQVEPTMVLNPTPPCIDIYPGDPSFDSTTGAMAADYAAAGDGFLMSVRARVAPNDNIANQEVLVELLDPDSAISVVQALYDDRTLEGHASDVSLTGPPSGFVLVPKIDGSGVHIGVIWRFLVIPARS